MKAHIENSEGNYRVKERNSKNSTDKLSIEDFNNILEKFTFSDEKSVYSKEEVKYVSQDKRFYQNEWKRLKILMERADLLSVFAIKNENFNIDGTKKILAKLHPDKLTNRDASTKKAGELITRMINFIVDYRKNK